MKKVEMVLKQLNVPYVPVKNGAELQYRCICPAHQDRHASASINTKSGLWYCFSCQERGNLNQFISIVTKGTKKLRDFMDEGDELKMTMDSVYTKSAETILSYENYSDFVMAYREEAENFIPALESCEATKYLTGKKRKLLPETIEHFKLKYAISGAYERRIIIPYYKNKLIVGMNSRYIGDCDSNYRYRYLINKPRFDDFLYNEDNLINKNYCILVEGPFDLMYMVQCGFKNVISTLNTRITNGHLKKLIGFKKIILCFDNDEETEAGQNAMIKHSKTILKYRPELPVYKVCLPVGKDPNECTPEELHFAMKHLHRIKIDNDS